MFDPIQIFINRTHAARFWFIMFMVSLSVNAVLPFLMVRALRSEEKYIVMDDAGTYHIARAKTMLEAHEIYEQVISDAVFAFYNRNPNGIDHERLFNQVYVDHALAYAKTEIERQMPEFAAKQMHQKAELARIESLSVDGKRILAVVRGQLGRSGQFRGQTFVEPQEFRMKMRLVANPYLHNNGRQPYVVSSMFQATRPLEPSS